VYHCMHTTSDPKKWTLFDKRLVFWTLQVPKELQGQHGSFGTWIVYITLNIDGRCGNIPETGAHYMHSYFILMLLYLIISTRFYVH